MNKEFIPQELEDQLLKLGYEYETNTHVLYQQAFRWFREKYKLEGFTEMSNDFNWYKFTIYYYLSDCKKCVDWGLEMNTYEEAELACLKKMIEIVKNK